MRSFILPLFAALLLGGAVENADAQARAVSLSDASYPPTMLHYVKPGRTWTPLTDFAGRPCLKGKHGYYSNVSAYQWNGSALGPQRWNRKTLVTYWRAGDVGAVVYDGLSFRNDTYAPVLVAGWCE